MAAAKPLGSTNPPASPSVLHVIGDIVRSPQLGSLVALAAAITLGVGLIMTARTPEFTPVFERMDSKDAARVADLLGASQYDYKIDPKTGAVLVPRTQLSEVRMQLSAAGIAASSEVGLEVLRQENSLGTSQFMEAARYQHALETELSRTISTMRNVQHARVHLALPKQSVFVRNRAKASASVMVEPLAGRSVEPGQVSAIVNLVASSIPYLETGQVTVVDQWGRLLSSIDDGSGSEQTRTQFEYTRKLEELLARRVEMLLTPILGEGRVRTSVTADVDFSVNEQTQELYDADPGKIRSEETRVSQSGNTNTPAAGVPGALTNQPNGVKPIATAADREGDVNNQATRNFELDKTIRHTRQAPGVIRRLAAAIIVDDKTVVGPDGEPQTAPLAADELENLTALVKEAIGFDEARGDSVIVVNQSFQPVAELAIPEPLPIWEQPWFADVVKQAFAGLGVLMLILIVVRPAMKNLKTRTAELAALPATADTVSEMSSTGDTRERSNAEVAELANSNGKDANQDSLPPPAHLYGDILHVARAMALEDPARVARVVKEWVGQGADAKS